MAEVLFYHLERAPLERVLPELLEKSLERGWTVVVQAGSQERLEALDTLLWTYGESTFLPHATAKEGRSERQPIFLTDGDDNPNAATVRFLVDGADADPSPYVRCVHLFDGRDEDAVRRAREQWSAAKAAGHEVAYWRQDETGRWTRQA